MCLLILTINVRQGWWGVCNVPVGITLAAIEVTASVHEIEHFSG